jgi:hypothetical protein
MMLCVNGQADGATEAAVNTIRVKEWKIRREKKNTQTAEPKMTKNKAPS